MSAPNIALKRVKEVFVSWMDNIRVRTVYMYGYDGETGVGDVNLANFVGE